MLFTELGEHIPEVQGGVRVTRCQALLTGPMWSLEDVVPLVVFGLKMSMGPKCLKLPACSGPQILNLRIQNRPGHFQTCTIVGVRCSRHPGGTNIDQCLKQGATACVRPSHTPLRLGRCVSGHGMVFTCASTTYTRWAPLIFFWLYSARELCDHDHGTWNVCRA